MGRVLNLTGERFGRLTVESRSAKSSNGVVYWNCRCECGNLSIVSRSNLKAGKTNSCGCLRKELSHTHNMANSRQYSIWCDMRKRCDNENSTSYSYYGGRGISYDSRWNCFEIFWQDMQQGYDEHLTLDRKDPRKGYSKDNCKWVTKQEQQRNKRIYKTNTTGLDGTYFSESKGIRYLVAHFTIPGGKRIRKFYSLSVRSLQEALKLAENWRNHQKELYNYGEFHGSSD